MKSASHVDGEDDFRERSENGDSVFRHRHRDQREDAVGGDHHDESRKLVHGLGHRVEEGDDGLSLFSRENGGNSEEKRENDELEHVSVDNGFERVSGEEVEKDVDNGGSRFRLGLRDIGQRHSDAGLYEVSENESDNDGDCGCREVQEYGLAADAPERSGVADGCRSDDEA